MTAILSTLMSLMVRPSFLLCYFLLLAIISDRKALEAYYFTPGFRSSGLKPCQWDMLHRQAPVKPPAGFLNTTRCYIERIKGTFSFLLLMALGLGDSHNIQKFNLYREDNNTYILTGIYIPSQHIILFINNKTFTDYNNITIYDSLIGYMKPNPLVTEFILYDSGISSTVLPDCVFPDVFLLSQQASVLVCTEITMHH